MDPQAKNFAITAYGRSGTMFLSTHMNRSWNWTVLHEPKQHDWTADNYGEVNSFLREEFEQLPVARKGVILRDPREIILSLCNRKPIIDCVTYAKAVHLWYGKILEWAKQPEIEVIEFDLMTTSKEYLEDVFHRFDITDIDMDQIDLDTIINPNKRTMYHTLPKLIQDTVDALDWDYTTKSPTCQK